MLKGNLKKGLERTRAAWAVARGWLRRVMPRVALAAGILFVVWAILANTRFNETPADNLLDSLTFIAVLVTLIYYGVSAKLWLKRKLLWRVRRRLIITYLFIGLTPVVLLGLLVLIASIIFAGQAMSRIVSVQEDATERETLAGARALADAFATIPPNADRQTIQRWLDERVALLQASLPGARVAVWLDNSPQAGGVAVGEDLGALGHARASEYLSAPSAGEEFRGVGGDQTPESAPLPEWLRGQAEWSGFAFFPPPEETRETFGTPSIRALVRRAQAGGRAYAILLAVPVSRALIRRYSESTGITVKPFFVGSEDVNVSADGKSVRVRTDDDELRERAEGDVGRGEVARDQFGEPIEVGGSYLVVLPATNWLSGERDSYVSFLFVFSWIESMKQLMSSTAFGQMLQQLLFWIAGIFLILELLALVAAGFMTRAVTGTVHRLYRATEFIKRGDFSHRISVRSHDQLGELALAFNEMSANIETLLEERVEHERLKREVEIAHEVQAQLFPRSVPELSSAEITGECRAARGVAGDYYDYVEVEPGLVAFTLGDVSGKGISAALVMSNLQASLRAQVAIIAERRKIVERATAATAPTSATTVDAVDALAPCGVTGVDTACAVENMVESINQQLCRSTDANRFATLFLAIYDDRARTLRYTNAGHNQPMLVRARGSVERLTVGGTIVGAFDFARYEEAQVALEPGDLLIVFSDGISEAQNGAEEEYGEGRLVEFVASNRDKTVENLRQMIFEEVDRWSGTKERGDDQTLVILKVKE